MKILTSKLFFAATLALVLALGWAVTPVVAGYNSYGACFSKCTKSDKPLTQKCRALSCGKLKGKAKIRCEKLCGMKEGIYDYCKSSCTKNESCLKSKKAKSCLSKCSEFRKSDIRKYQKCRKTCTKNCVPF